MGWRTASRHPGRPVKRSSEPSERRIDTPVGPARAVLHPAATPAATLVLGHGAGGGIDARDLTALARALPAYGVSVVLVEQPWRLAGRRLAPAPAVLDRGWLAAVPALEVGGPLVVGGRSAGARVACRTASALGAVGCLALAFPLHPPGRPERSRVAELQNPGVPTLVVQGERDPFGRPEEFLSGGELVSVTVRPVPAADHGFAVPRRSSRGQEETLADVVADVARWTLGLDAGLVGME